MMLSAQDVLNRYFGYSQFRGQQEAIINTLVAGQDALVIMPTGGGKSLCYQIPAILRPGCGVVVSPLIALMQDQVDALELLGIRAGFLNSSQSYEEVNNIKRSLLNGELNLLYVAPERLNQPQTIALLKQVSIALFAIDEAHCVSQWGHDFRADYLQLHLLAQHFPRVPRIALTATADARTQKEIIDRLCLYQVQRFVAGFDRPNIHYSISLKQQPKQQLLRFLKGQETGDAGIVYCLSRKKTEAIAEWLSEQGFTALAYHAGLSHEQRAMHQKRFLREDGIIIVATIAFGMGIDKPDVRFVAHLDLPKSVEAYYQETGRAGRDGEAANAWMVYGLEDVIKLREMMAASSANDEYKRVEYQKLEAMLGLCEVTSCRRQALLHYFGDDAKERCGNCDTCLEPVDTWDGTEAAQKAMSCIYRTGQRFGVSHLVDVLMGADTLKVNQFQHQQLSVYGIGKDMDKQQWRSVYRQLIARGLLAVDSERFNAVVLTEDCRRLLRGETQIQLRRDPVKSSALRKVSKTKALQKHGTLWEALRSCRTALAREKGVAPYMIFHDSVLMEMAEQQPSNTIEFSRLNGVGAVKQKQYADDFLAVIKQHRESPSNDLSATVLETERLLNTGADIEVVAQERGLALTTIYQHASQLIRLEKLALERVVKLDTDEIQQIENHLIDNGTIDETARLKPVYDALGERYDYHVLRCVHAHVLSKL